MIDWPLVIGTAGHVDHGKTTLIKALTGIDTDRLAEEKRRGLTIDLGFAPFALPSGRVASVVDVPGHEKFLKNMLAGAPGMDLVLLVVAADDGVMPQTREHLDILALLHARRGVVVVTKTDLVEPELLELAHEEIVQALRGTFLEGAPVIDVCAPTGAGLEQLRVLLDELAGTTRPREAARPFRLPIDRVFVKQGFGTVVTGTLFSGTLREGDAVSLLPAGVTSRVRGLQVHGGKREQAVAGQRVAVNLAGLERSDLGRGDWLLLPDHLAISQWLDVYLELLPGALPLEHRTRVRVHHGTAEILGRVRLLDRDALEPGQGALAQLELESPAVADFHDRFVLRRYAPMTTIGGGLVLDPRSQRHRRHRPEVLEALAAAREDRWEDVGGWQLRAAGAEGLSRAQLLGRLPFEAAEGVLASLLDKGEATWRRDRLVHRDARDQQEAKVLGALARGHATSPWRLGVPREQLQAAIQVPLKVLLSVLEGLARAGEVRAQGRLWALSGHAVRLDPMQARTQTTLRERLAAQRFLAEVDAVAELPAPARDLLDDLIEAGEAHRVGQGMLAASPALEAARQAIRASFSQAPFTASQARELLGTNRKAIIPLLEYLDSQGFTKRQGDARVLARP